MARRRVTDRGLVLEPTLLNQELASPKRRFAAFALDLAILAIPSLILATLVGVAALAIREPTALRALADLIGGKASNPEAAANCMRDLIPLMVKYEMPGTPAETIAAFEAGNLTRALESIADYDLMITLNVETAGTGDNQIRIELARLIPPLLRLVAFYGLAAVYFSWLTSRRSGASLGKRKLGIRVVRIDNQQLGLFESFERFVGYFQVPASLGTAIFDFWRDANRRLPHDRLSGTIVIMSHQRP